ncbi:MAG: EF-hand domain-containing protein [Caulobacteraceae bacterium]|nr:EF-hand domain-containing protein [Caulobacteraceae bacterium]
MPFMMLIANSEEADRDGDGALSREEFVAQHLRFFDASDANGDGRVRFEEPPRPPEPPAPPAPPEPLRRR